MKILIIIPAYNEEKNILNTLEDLSRYCPRYDKVVINDASVDSTKEILKRKGVCYINLPINLGIGGCVQTGYVYAEETGYDIAVQMDGDGQHCAEEIEKIIKPIIEKEADVVVGSRFIEKRGFQSSKARRIGIRILSGLINWKTGQKINDVTSGFRAVNKKYIHIFASEYASDYPEPESLVVATRYDAIIKEIPVIMRDRSGGNSSISSLKSVYYMFKVSMAILLQKGPRRMIKKRRN